MYVCRTRGCNFSVCVACPRGQSYAIELTVCARAKQNHGFFRGTARRHGEVVSTLMVARFNANFTTNRTIFSPASTITAINRHDRPDRYTTPGTNKLKLLEHTLECRLMAPTAPDTLGMRACPQTEVHTQIWIKIKFRQRKENVFPHHNPKPTSTRGALPAAPTNHPHIQRATRSTTRIRL